MKPEIEYKAAKGYVPETGRIPANSSFYFT